MQLIRHIYLIFLIISMICMAINICIALVIGGTSDDQS